MSEYQSYYEDFNTGYWCDPDPKKCPCRGGGWCLSELDTWHKCPEHWTKESVHPEDYYPDRSEEVQAEVVEFEYEEESLSDPDECPF